MASNITESPQLGEIRMARDIGKLTYLSTRYIWVECSQCHKQRWIPYSYYADPKKNHTGFCRECNYLNCGWHKDKSRIPHAPLGEKHWSWKGGRNRNKQGYIQVRLYPDDFFYPMVNNTKRVFEHRLVMAKSLGRCLYIWEIVHHKNGIRDDNRIENLQLVTDDKHTQITLMERRIKFLESRITQLEAEVILLKETSHAVVS